MKTRIVKYSLLSTIATILVTFLLGCASFGPTKPNLIYKQYPAYNEFAQRNLLLADEIGKLPELQDGVSAGEAAALKNILDLYHEDSDAFDKAFEEMYKVGLPDVRKYCSPLQALFWLAEEGKLSEENNPMVDYSLDKLLRNAWKFEEKSLMLSEKETKKVIDSIKYEDERKDYFYLTRIEDINEIILLDYNKNPNIFSKEAREIIKNSLRENLRWKDFNTVADRLNAPELIDHWEKGNLEYEFYLGALKSNKSIFKSKRANCYDTSNFTVYCLEKAGYRAGLLWVDSPFIPEGHIITYYKDKGKKYIMDNGRMAGPLGILGPYESLKEIGYTIQGFL